MKQLLPLAEKSLGSFVPINDFAQNPTTQDGALNSLEIFISHMLGLLTIIGSIFFVVSFFLAALNWISAQGESAKLQKSREQMIQGVVGLVIIIASYGIIGLIGTVVGLNLLSPKEAILNLPLFK
ncbi:hypothetical protein KA078_04080 [Candidatus Woesebacteria bacterium]|nr:hypothetical protein [Candidatus Woesebacteria bacterium]